MELPIINISTKINDYILEDDTIYQAALFYNNTGLLIMQGNKEFYIPTLGKIIEIGTYGYIKNSKETVNLKRFIKVSMGVPTKVAGTLCRIIQIYIAESRERQEIFDMLDEAEVKHYKAERIQD